MTEQPEILQGFIGAIIGGIGSAVRWLFNQGGAHRIASTTESIHRTAQAAHNIVRTGGDFGQTPGDLARRDQEQAYPGTTPWERLGAGGGGIGGLQAAEQQGRQASSAAAMQSDAQVRIAKINALGALGREIFKANPTFRTATDVRKNLERAARGDVSQRHDRTTSGMADGTGMQDPNQTQQYRLTEAQAQEILARKDQAMAQIEHWAKTRKLEDRRIDIDEAMKEIAEGRLELDEESRPGMLYWLEQAKEALNSGALLEVINAAMNSMGAVAAATFISLLMGAAGRAGGALIGGAIGAGKTAMFNRKINKLIKE